MTLTRVRLRPDGDPETGPTASGFVDPAAIRWPAPVERTRVASTNAAVNLTAGTREMTSHVEELAAIRATT